MLDFMRKIVGVLALLGSVFCTGCENDSGPAVERIRQVAPIAVTPDQVRRRERSEAYCKAHKIPVYPIKGDFYVSAEKNTTVRTPDEITDRLLALCYAELKSEKTEKSWLDSFDRKYNVSPKLSPKERIFMNSSAPTDQELIDAGWKVECMHVLLWALGYVDTLGYPSQACDVDATVLQVFSRTAGQLRDGARPRTKAELLDQADLLLRMHWACEEARLNNTPIPGGLESDVIMEWHYALNWLIGYQNQSWDEITTDT